MTTASTLIEQLAALKITSAGVTSPVQHNAVENVADWKAELNGKSLPDGVTGAPVFTKTLVLKPKLPKSQPTSPVMVIAKDETDTNMTSLAKELKLKELRFANADLLSGFFATEKGSVSPFSLSQVAEADRSNVTIVVDSTIVADSESYIAFHPLVSSQTIFVKSSELLAYIKSLNGFKSYVVVDFAELASKNSAPAAAPAAPKASSQKAKPAAAAAAAEPTTTNTDGIQALKEDDFPSWYQQVLTRSDMLEYYDVSGCYIIRPWAFHVWDSIQTFFDGEIRKLKVKNCSFPMFVSSRVLEREKDHIEGFAPEVAWVTKAGSSDLEEPIALRPTSETVMYPYYAKWIRSHRDLPLRLNQWCNVVRWEFKNPQPFLRTREFLWQEGHCAYLHEREADEEARAILTLYRRVYEELLAVPVVEGRKSEKEKFAGAHYTTSIEGYIPATGRGIQAATSHNLGQNFSKMFDIAVEDPDVTAKKLYAWQTSWGLSTRTIGVMVMVHGDNKGLVMPPRVSEIQVIVIPCGITVKHSDEQRKAIHDACHDAAKALIDAGIRAEVDDRENYSPGFKFNHWEVRGVPIRLEIGPKDLEKKSTVAVRRDKLTKSFIPVSELAQQVSSLLDTIHNDMLAKATAEFAANRKLIQKWEDFVPALNNKAICVIPWCNREACEDEIKTRSANETTLGQPEDSRAPSMGAKSLCIPYDQSAYPPIKAGETKCVQCGKDAECYALFGRSY
ncbi:hypothetical protein H4219_004285 [Mycoemilia scoparia]|uniref:proline--tRNA ligase n=1 Tax=Mycoemilia scoparia TaxID=417184 RepID=A0A9W7ZSR4_9FUNG|nr:hypothetical protein H4219_004285 [Mycoemilia scoparia]